MNDLPVTHLIGIEFFRFSNLKSLDIDNYFNCLDLLRELFKGPDFRNSTPGFYINFIRNKKEDGDDGKDSLRLTYFTIDTRKTDNTIKSFVRTHSGKIGIYESKNSVRPASTELVSCDAKLLKFRKFLNTYAQIGLDLLAHSIPETRKLVAKYRSQRYSDQHYPPCGLISSKAFFESFFSEHSIFFNRMGSQANENLWEDLDYWDPERNQPWDHYLVNMLLPFDGREWALSILNEYTKNIKILK